ncbi:MAG: hypothetical protein KAR19_12760 [Bacteroidales bacterium]|nr:hypothetical protein [Bacteroidales bacterium]
MKTTFAIIYLISLSIYTFGQPFGSAAPGYRVAHQEYKNSSGEIASTSFNYDCAGRLSRGYWTLEDRSRSSINDYTHDENGWLISAYREFSDGLTSLETFTYDSAGNKTAENFFRSDGVKGSAIYHYEDQLLTNAEFKNHKGWLKGTVTFKYDSQRRRIGANIMQSDHLIGQINYNYDDCNNLIKESWNFGETWSQVFHYRYSKVNGQKHYYSSPFLSPLEGYRIKGEHFTFNGETGGPSYYHYDKNGLLYRKEFIRSDSVFTSTTYQYDTDRKLTSSTRYYSNGDTARFYYTYDKCKHLVLKTCHRSDSITGFESYMYAPEGVLQKACMKNFDNWLTGTITFKSDFQGAIQEGSFKGEDGFDARIGFEYNSEGLLSGIIWEFTFGKFQQYSFEYEPEYPE